MAMAQSGAGALNPSAILAKVARLAGASVPAIRSASRRRAAVEARQAAIYALAACGLRHAAIAVLVNRRRRTISDTLQMLDTIMVAGNIPRWLAPVTAYIDELLDGSRARSVPDHQVAREALAALSLTPANRRALTSYINCRLLGFRHLPGACHCLAGLQLLMSDPPLATALATALEAINRPGHAGTVTRDAARTSGSVRQGAA